MKYAAAVLLLLLAFAAVRAYRTDAAYEQFKRETQDTVAVLTASADSSRAAASRDSARAEVNAARADSAIAVADAVRASVDARIAALAPVPPVAVPFTEPRDAIIRGLRAENDALRTALSARNAEAGDLRAAYADLDAAYRHERTGRRLLEELVDARPGGQWWRPRTGVGGFAGLCISGPCVGVGVTVDIDIPFL